MNAAPHSPSDGLQGHCLLVHIFDVIFWTVLEAVNSQWASPWRSLTASRHQQLLTEALQTRAFPWGLSGQEDCWSRGVWGRWESQYPYELSCISNKRKVNKTKTLTLVQNPAHFLPKRPFALILSIQTPVFSPQLTVTCFKKTNSSPDCSPFFLPLCFATLPSWDWGLAGQKVLIILVRQTEGPLKAVHARSVW